MTATLAQLNVSDGGMPKLPVPSARVTRDGVDGDHQRNKKYHGGPNRAELIDVLIRNTRVKDRALYDKMHWGFIDPNGVLLKDSLRDQVDWYARQGMITKRIDVDAIIDERYVRYALEKLGVQR